MRRRGSAVAASAFPRGERRSGALIEAWFCRAGGERQARRSRFAIAQGRAPGGARAAARGSGAQAAAGGAGRGPAGRGLGAPAAEGRAGRSRARPPGEGRSGRAERAQAGRRERGASVTAARRCDLLRRPPPLPARAPCAAAGARARPEEAAAPGHGGLGQGWKVSDLGPAAGVGRVGAAPRRPARRPEAGRGGRAGLGPAAVGPAARAARGARSAAAGDVTTLFLRHGAAGPAPPPALGRLRRRLADDPRPRPLRCAPRRPRSDRAANPGRCAGAAPALQPRAIHSCARRPAPSVAG